VQLAYDGSRYSGFQLQGAGRPTVQGAVERALGRIAKRERRAAWHVQAAGRTDAGE
jgi:tRNA pseudouridine(38-40) synthase